MYDVWLNVMMKRTNIYLDPAQLKILKKIGARIGPKVGAPKGLKVAQVIRMAISQFVEKEGKEK